MIGVKTNDLIFFVLKRDASPALVKGFPSTCVGKCRAAVRGLTEILKKRKCPTLRKFF